MINGTEIPNYQTIVSPTVWDWDYGTKRGRRNESEYTVVAVDFYNNIRSYLAELIGARVHNLEDIVAYNLQNDGTEGGTPGTHAAFARGQDGFLASLAMKGVRDDVYWQALEFCQRSTREDGIDAALKYEMPNGSIGTLDSLLVPANVGQSYQIAAQAGYPMITIPAGINNYGMPYGLGLMNSAWSEPEAHQVRICD